MYDAEKFMLQMNKKSQPVIKQTIRHEHIHSHRTALLCFSGVYFWGFLWKIAVIHQAKISQRRFKHFSSLQFSLHTTQSVSKTVIIFPQNTLKCNQITQ